ncbi:MAG: glycosyltransferase 87 family protein [Candidatus Binatia bacterium]|nr:glycosyltransferase 87 family protein [Candidatus Binatia bacterium]
MYREIASARAALLVLGGVSWCLYLGIAWLSTAFVYGQNHLQRPILAFVSLYALAFLLYCVAVRVLPGSYRRAEVWLVLALAVVFRLSLLHSQPIQEDDFYRYLWDGKVVASGFNPYRVTPLAVRNALPDSHPEELLQPYTRILVEHPVFLQIVARVNHPAIPTIYPPFAQALFGLAALVAPGSLVALRLFFLAFDLGLCGVLVAILARLGLSPLWVLVYAWSPLVIKETVNSAHYDVVPTFFLLLGVLLVLSNRSVLAHASLAVAVLGKVYPLLVLPLFCWRTWLTQGRMPALLGLGVFAVVLGLGYMPFASAGMGLWRGTVTFAEHWENNSFLFPLIRTVLGERWLATVVVCLALGMAVVLLVRWVDMRDARAFVWATFSALGALFLLSPVAFPWYFVWIVPFLCCFPLRAWLLLSGLLGLYYLFFYYLYRGTPESFRWIVWIEYGLFYAVVLWEFLVRNRFAFPLKREGNV